MLAAAALAGCDVAGDTRYLQFDWSATVDGRPVRISHAVECVTKEVPAATSPFAGTRSVFVPRQRNSVVNLPDGSRLYVEHAEICSWRLRPNASAQPYDPAKVRPIVYRWFRTDASPRIEVYYSDAYFASPRARIAGMRWRAEPIADDPAQHGLHVAPCPDVDPLRPLAWNECRTGDDSGHRHFGWYYAQAFDARGRPARDVKAGLQQYFDVLAELGWIAGQNPRLGGLDSDIPVPELARIANTSRPLLIADDGCGVIATHPVGHLVLREIPQRARFEEYCASGKATRGKRGPAALDAPDVFWRNWIPAQ